MFRKYVDVWVKRPVQNAFTYLVPEDLPNKPGIGHRVIVPFHGQELEGIICGMHRNDPEYTVQPLVRVIDPEPILNAEQLELVPWMAQTYLAGPGECVFKMVPRGRRWPEAASNRLSRKIQPEKRPLTEHSLNKEQNAALVSILIDLKRNCQKNTEGGVAMHLLHGITGSGKTEVYIHAIRECLASGRTALFLVPEISLTVQLVDRLQRVFGKSLALLHSALSGAERFGSYVRLKRGEARIAVGTRSAVFAPLKNIGLIIIDEEHDASFKEHSTPRYDARRIAFKRARSNNAVLLPGSATPRMETIYPVRRPGHAKNFHYHILKERATGASLPEVQVVEWRAKDIPLSGQLVNEIDKNIKAGEQTILLLNRRGYNPGVLCKGCESLEQCPACAVSLNLHKNGRLICHYCGYQRKFDGLCSCPKKAHLVPLGSGTQKLEEYLLNLFPGVRLERLDTDVVSRRGVLTETIGRLLQHEIDILIGTQMIAKGLDAPGVTLVGVLQADAGLSLPDFRAVERVFQLLTQVAGRAGRGARKGRVIFECMQADDPVIHFAAEQNYEAFYQDEILRRHAVSYPPFVRLLRLVVRSEEESRARGTIEELAAILREPLLDLRAIKQETDLQHQSGVRPQTQGWAQAFPELVGPVSAPLERLHGQYRFHLLIKFLEAKPVRDLLARILAKYKIRGAYLEIDFDPVDIL